MMPVAERKARRYERIQLPKGILVVWQATSGGKVSRAHTLGLGGLFISTPDPPPVGTILKVLFDVPDGEVRSRALVRSVNPGKGMGIEFVQMGYEDRGRLRRLLNRLLQ